MSEDTARLADNDELGRDRNDGDEDPLKGGGGHDVVGGGAVMKHDVSSLVEEIGWGRYHWKIVIGMGMMSFADAAEIWIISLISKDLICEWKLSALQEALIPGLVFLFMAIGSLTAGELSDVYGRRKVLLIVYYTFTVASLLSAFAWNYYSFLVLRSVAGFCIGANYGVSICYSAEMVPITKRGFTLLLLDMFWVAGGVYVCLVAFFVMDIKHGWRILILLTTLPCVIVIFIIHLCDESVRYLVISERNKEALEVFNKMASENGKAPIEGEIMASEVDRGSIIEVFRKPFTRTTFMIGVMFFAITWAFYGFFYLLPDMMSYGYCHLSDLFETTMLNDVGCTVYTKAEYLFLMVVNLLYIPGYIVSPVSAENWGRIPTLRLSYWCSLVFTLTLLICLLNYITYVELFLLVNFYGMAIATVWLYMPECYPTYIRSTATGTQNAISKLGAAGGTFVTEYVDSVNIRYSIIIISVVLLLACVASIFLVQETMGKALKDEREPESIGMTTLHHTNYGASDGSPPQEPDGTAVGGEDERKD